MRGFLMLSLGAAALGAVALVPVTTSPGHGGHGGWHGGHGSHGGHWHGGRRWHGGWGRGWGWGRLGLGLGPARLCRSLLSPLLGARLWLGALPPLVLLATSAC
jgi:hypothetical protein